MALSQRAHYFFGSRLCTHLETLSYHACAKSAVKVEQGTVVEVVTPAPAVTHATPPEESAVMDVGDACEIDRMGAWPEVVTKSRSAGTSAHPR